MQAYYLAESGSERGLYQLRRREGITDCHLLDSNLNCGQGNNCCSVDGYCPFPYNTTPCINQTGGFDWNIRGGWSTQVSNERVTTVLLNPGDSFQLDLFNPVQNLQSNINAIGVDGGFSGLKLYADLINVTKVLNVNNPEVAICLTKPAVSKGEVDPQSGIPILALDNQEVLGQCSYTFRLHYPLNSVTEPALIKISAYQDLQTQLDIPSRLIIDSQATYGRSLQKIRVRTPMRSPLSGLYDFVLFSEEEIIK
jgi:hypothetical protein